MDTQESLETETTNVVAELTSALEKARAQLERLNEVATDAETEASRWETTFQKEPTPQAHTSAAVARQKATNARAEAQAFERETVNRLERQKQENETAIERELLRINTDWMHAEAELERMLEAVVSCRATLGEASKALVDFLWERHHASPRANSLGLGLGPKSLERVIGELNAKLQDRDAPTSLAFVYTGNPGLLRLEVTMPLRPGPTV
jgi:hypothetical protein